MIDELLQLNEDGLEEVIIGLVGAVGSNLSTVQNILKTELEELFKSKKQEFHLCLNTMIILRLAEAVAVLHQSIVLPCMVRNVH